MKYFVSILFAVISLIDMCCKTVKSAQFLLEPYKEIQAVSDWTNLLNSKNIILLTNSYINLALSLFFSLKTKILINNLSTLG